MSAIAARVYRPEHLSRCPQYKVLCNCLRIVCEKSLASTWHNHVHEAWKRNVIESGNEERIGTKRIETSSTSFDVLDNIYDRTDPCASGTRIMSLFVATIRKQQWKRKHTCMAVKLHVEGMTEAFNGGKQRRGEKRGFPWIITSLCGRSRGLQAGENDDM
ncbi:hypothetical protein BDR06DRAFT_953357, partial [Suillus hirtellus]